MILGFVDRGTAAVFAGEQIEGLPPAIQNRARQKLKQIDAAQRLDDLMSPPGLRLEALRGDRAGRHGIRINDQWRVCFVWKGVNADEVEIVDYH